MKVLIVALLIGQFSMSAFGAEPLFSAIAQHQEAAALQLVAAMKTDVNARDANGDTPLALHLAALHPEPDFAKGTTRSPGC